MSYGQRLFLVTFLLMVILACNGNVDPKDTTVQNALTSTAMIYYGIFDKFGIFSSLTGAPRISEVQQAADENTYSFSGMWPIDDELLEKESLSIYLYEMVPDGCGKMMKKGRFLGQTDSISSIGEWEISDVFIPEDVNFFSSILVVDEKEFSKFGNSYLIVPPDYASELGEISIKDAGDYLMNVAFNQQAAVEIGDAVISGKGTPGTCYNIWRDGQRLRQFEVSSDGNWSFTLDVKAGDNPLEFRLSNPGTSQTTEINVVGTVEKKLIWPIGSSDENGNYISDFENSRITAWSGTNDFHIDTGYPLHHGIDIGFSQSSSPDISAVADGKIHQFGWDPLDDKGFGYYVIIDHGEWASVYGHLKENPGDLDLKKGENILAGTKIGVMGETGFATGPHLHLEAFRWPDIQNKSNTQIHYDQNFKFNLNPSDLETCPSKADFWEINWSDIKIDFTKDGVYFTECHKSNRTCVCIE